MRSSSHNASPGAKAVAWAANVFVFTRRASERTFCDSLQPTLSEARAGRGRLVSYKLGPVVERGRIF